MKRLAALVAALAISGLLTTGAQAQDVKKDAENLVANIDLLLLEVVQLGFFVEDGVSTLLDNQAGQNFHQARALYLQRHFDRAADQVRNGAALIGLEAVLATTDEDYDKLMISYYELLILADDLKEKALAPTKVPHTVKPLDAAFARAHASLAKAKTNKAREYWSLKGQMRVGLNILSAAKHVGHWAAWSGQEIPEKTRIAFKDARTTARAMVAGDSFVPADVETALKALDGQIAALEGKIAPVRKRAEVDERKMKDENRRSKRAEKRAKSMK